MVKSKRSKLVKATNGGGIDRISDLPDPLLSHILSLLPTQNAVATSVLSTRWKFLWTFITNLEFRYDEDCPRFHCKENKKKHKMQMKKFARYVNRVLLLLNSPSIQDFRLFCSDKCFNHSYLNSWIFAGFGRTVGEFDLSLTLDEPLELRLTRVYSNVAVITFSGDIHFNIPAAASVCFPSLQALYLYGITCEIASNSSVSFSNLKIMHLDNVNFLNRDSIHKLFSSSPVLDDLTIERDEDVFDDEECLIIRIPSLKNLSIHFRTSRCDYDCTDKVLIDSPALQYLSIFDSWPHQYLPGENLSSLLQANVEILLSECDYDNVEKCISIVKFLGSLSNVEFLSVSGDVVKAVRTASASISTCFHNLTQLEITVDDCLDFSIIIMNFLENMDNLEDLVMECSECYSCSHHPRWTAPLNVPKCLLSGITTFTFHYTIDGCCDQLELLRYFLKHAKVLRLLKICTANDSAEKKLELLKKISLIPRRSQRCQVVFT